MGLNKTFKINCLNFIFFNDRKISCSGGKLDKSRMFPSENDGLWIQHGI